MILSDMERQKQKMYLFRFSFYYVFGEAVLDADM